MWTSFQTEFQEMWSSSLKDRQPGDFCPTALFADDASAGPDALQVCNFVLLV